MVLVMKDWRSFKELLGVKYKQVSDISFEFYEIYSLLILLENESLHFERLDRELSIEFPTYFSVEDLVLSVYGKNES